MKRMKRHKVKSEPGERTATQSHGRPDRDCDLAHYVHDRVELLQRAFAALRPRELKAMAPACVSTLSPDDLQELCLEELLGISSVRLCAVLDGAEPPSDTESSSESSAERRLETISLDSISSDERALSPLPVQHHTKKRKRRCKRSGAAGAPEPAEARTNRAAERAGLTVLELLELQARARAIRAQLAMERTHTAKGPQSSETVRAAESDNDVQIKEEPPEVVELSSDDEAPAPANGTLSQNQLKSTQSQVSIEETEAVTKTRTDLTIIVPKTHPRKIKLKRSKVAAKVLSTQKQAADVHTQEKTPTVSKEVTTNNTDSEVSKCTINSENKKTDERKNKKAMARQAKQKRKKQESQRNTEKEGSDHDEIMLQLSDSEKMDLLEDFDRKNYDISSSESVASSSDSESAQINQCDVKHTDNGQDNQLSRKTTVATQLLTDVIEINSTNVETLPEDGPDIIKIDDHGDRKIVNHDNEPIVVKDSDQENVIQNSDLTCPNKTQEGSEQKESESIPLNDEKAIERSIEACDHEVMEVMKQNKVREMNDNLIQEVTNSELVKIMEDDEKPVEVEQMRASDKNHEKAKAKKKRTSKKESSDISDQNINNDKDNEEPVEVEQMVRASDKNNEKTKAKKKRTSKKESSDISDQNINKDKDNEKLTEQAVVTAQSDSIDDAPYSDGDSVYEILEISDDSSCYEVEGVSILSKEPTSEEIEALSAKIDHEIEREEGATDPELEQVSWKHRYLDSKKVKKIMSTSNILNALRKKNKELKRKLEESRTVQLEVIEVEKPAETTAIATEEGTIDQYNTLESCTKYVEPAPPPPAEVAAGPGLHKAMEKDAKQLLKMYKRLLKYNNMEKDRNKTKSKKKRSKKKKSTDNSHSKTAEG